MTRLKLKSIIVVSGISEREVAVIGGDLKGHVGALAEEFDGVHGVSGFGVGNTEGVRILEFGEALYMVVCNTMFKKRPSRLITYESGGIKSQIDYFLVRRLDRKLVKDVKTIGGEECTLQHRLLVCDGRLSWSRRKRKPYIPRRRAWKLRDRNVKEHFLRELLEMNLGNPMVGENVESCWNCLKEGLLRATEKTFGWSKGPARHEATWWWNNEVDMAISRKNKTV